MPAEGDDPPGWLSNAIKKASPSTLRGIGAAAAQLTMTRLYGDLAGNLEAWADGGLVAGAALCIGYAMFGVIRGR